LSFKLNKSLHRFNCATP